MVDKIDRLKGILKEMDSVLIAFSGGVDSSLLLKVAKDVLGDNVVALTATSPTYTGAELKNATRVAEEIGVRHIIVESNELDIPDFSRNAPDRCYHCKAELFTIAKREADRLGLKWIADGSNIDDLNDHRPGREAARDLGVRSPLVEAGIGKEDIRFFSRELGLSTWDKPSMACLSSRFPYGVEITPERVRMVDEAEEFLRSLGFRQLRVRFHGDIARIELDKDDLFTIFNDGLRKRVIDRFKEIGFTYIAIDLEGYRTGSLNEALRYRAS